MGSCENALGGRVETFMRVPPGPPSRQGWVRFFNLMTPGTHRRDHRPRASGGWSWIEVALHGTFYASLLLAVSLVTGCFIPQTQFTDKHRDFSLGKGELAKHGLAFITPSTVTGQEEEKQGLALIAAEVLKEKRPDIRCVALAETLSEVNKAGLADQYKDMYIDYRDTGLFKKDMLKQIGELTGVQYVAQLKLASFSQTNRNRFQIFGLRILETQKADLRLVLQIWNTHEGAIAWEIVEELSYAQDSVFSGSVALRTVLEEVLENAISHLE
jgi:hypothetical protein